MDGPTGKGVVSDHKEHPVIGVPMPGQCRLPACPQRLLSTQMPVLSPVSYDQGHRVPLHQAEQEQMPVALFIQMEQCDWEACPIQVADKQTTKQNKINL